MKESILIIGPQRSGKTTKLKEIQNLAPTKYFLDGATTIEEIDKVINCAINDSGHALVTTQLSFDEIPTFILAKFNKIDITL